MRPAVVVQPDRFVDGASCLFSVEECPAEAVLLFEDAIQSLGHGVFRTVIDLRHAHRQVMLFQASNVFVTAELASTIRVMNRVLVDGQFFESLIQRLERFLDLEPFTAVITDDLAGVQIRDQRQILEVLPGPEIGDIADPNLIRAGCFELGNQIPVHRQ